MTLYFIFVVFESLGCIIAFVNVDLKDIIPSVHPRSIQKKELMACLVYEVLVSAVDGNGSVFFIRTSMYGVMKGPPTLGHMSRVVAVVGDVYKPAVEAVHFSLRRVFLHFVLSGNLKNAAIWLIK